MVRFAHAAVSGRDTATLDRSDIRRTTRARPSIPKRAARRSRLAATRTTVAKYPGVRRVDDPID
jgi:hypothetical protein